MKPIEASKRKILTLGTCSALKFFTERNAAVSGTRPRMALAGREMRYLSE
jgi:hypothetical protein